MQGSSTSSQAKVQHLSQKGSLSLSLLDMGTGQSPRASKPTQCLLIGFRGVRNECRTSIGLQPSSLRCRFQDVRTLSSTYVSLALSAVPSLRVSQCKGTKTQARCMGSYACVTYVICEETRLASRSCMYACVFMCIYTLYISGVHYRVWVCQQDRILGFRR